jgi:hypothetical protein
MSFKKIQHKFLLLQQHVQNKLLWILPLACKVPPHLCIKILFEANEIIDNFKEYQNKRINSIHWMSDCRLPE